MKQTNAIIIGFGKGGKTLAAALASAGRSVTLIEQSPAMYGGTCINAGCIPSKSLKASAEHSARLGGGYAEKAVRYAQAVEEKERLTSMLRNKNYHKLADNPLIEVLDGRASFTGQRSVSVQRPDGSAEELTAELIFINTGSLPSLPSIDGAKDNQYVFTSERLMSLPALPERLVIIGGGYIGVEFASMYARFGSRVTVLQHGDVFLPREDEEISAAALERLRALGVDVLFSASARRIQEAPGYAELSVDTPKGPLTLKAEAVLLAAGRRPNISGLNLEAAGIQLNSRGAIAVDEHLRTSNPAVYAMGDVTGGLQFTYISLDDCRIALSSTLGDGSRTTDNRGAVPYSVFLDPPFSRVGLTEREAREQGYSVKIARLPAAAIPKAQVLGETAGLLKAVIDEKTNCILGAHIFCAESHEIINILKLAIDMKVPFTTLRDGIYTHPTMAESLNDLFS